MNRLITQTTDQCFTTVNSNPLNHELILVTLNEIHAANIYVACTDWLQRTVPKVRPIAMFIQIPRLFKQFIVSQTFRSSEPPENEVVMTDRLEIVRHAPEL